MATSTLTQLLNYAGERESPTPFIKSLLGTSVPQIFSPAKLNREQRGDQKSNPVYDVGCAGQRQVLLPVSFISDNQHTIVRGYQPKPNERKPPSGPGRIILADKPKKLKSFKRRVTCIQITAG